MAKPGRPPGVAPACAGTSGGRPKGVKNKNIGALQEAIEAVLAPLCPGWDPVIAMAKIAALGCIPTYNPELGIWIDIPVSESTRTTCHKEVAEYIHAKRRAVEMSGGLDVNLGGVLRVPTPQTPEQWDK